MARSGYVLVVDDEADIVTLIVDFLREEGYVACGAHNAETALAIIAAHPPAIILLDLFMPQASGLDLWDHLQRDEFSDVSVVLMTASPRAAETMREKGVADYLAKPFDLDQLLECVSRYVRAGAPESVSPELLQP